MTYLAFHRVPNSDEPFYGEGDDQPDCCVAGGIDQRSSDRQPVPHEPRPRLDRVVVLPGHGERQRQVDGVADGQRGEVDVGGAARHGAAREHDDGENVGKDAGRDDGGRKHALDDEARHFDALPQSNQLVGVNVDVGAASRVVVQRRRQRPVARHLRR